MKRQFERWHRALTLIETAAVITVFSGAMAILLPTLKQAREAAKLHTCLGNIGQIGKAFISYTHDQGNIPLYSIDKNGDGASEGWCDWAYGGWSGTHRAEWEQLWPGYNIQTRERPLSVFMTSWEIPEEANRYTPTQEMPVFKCPSDQFSVEWMWGSWPTPDITPCKFPWDRPAYQDVGTSYVSNWYWWRQAYDDYPSKPWEELDPIGNRVFHKYMEKEASRFVTLFEDPANMGLFWSGDPTSLPGVQVLGFHGEFSKHVSGFADGHAEYLYMDTRHGHDSAPYPLRHLKYTNGGSWSACDWLNDHASGGRHY